MAEVIAGPRLAPRLRTRRDTPSGPTTNAPITAMVWAIPGWFNVAAVRVAIAASAPDAGFGAPRPVSCHAEPNASNVERTPRHGTRVATPGTPSWKILRDPTPSTPRNATKATVPG